MGVKQCLDVIVDAAALCRSDHSMQFLLVGDGAVCEKLQRKSAELALGNVLFLPLLKEEDFRGLLAASDVCLLTQQKSVSEIAFPSKVVTYLAAGCAVIASVNPDSEIARTIRESGAGRIVAPEDAEALLAAILDYETRICGSAAKMRKSTQAKGGRPRAFWGILNKACYRPPHRWKTHWHRKELRDELHKKSNEPVCSTVDRRVLLVPACRTRPTGCKFGSLRCKPAAIRFNGKREHCHPRRRIQWRFNLGGGEKKLRLFRSAGRSLARRLDSPRSHRRPAHHDTIAYYCNECFFVQRRPSLGVLQSEVNQRPK